MAVCYAENELVAQSLKYFFLHTTYAAWYQGEVPLPGLGLVGEKNLPLDQRVPLPPKPLLKLGYIPDPTPEAPKPTLAFPSAVQERFMNHEVYVEKWKTFLVENEKKYGKPPSAATDPEQRVDPSRHVDLTVKGPQPPPPAVTHPAESMKTLAELDSIRLVKAQLASNKKIMIHITEADGVRDVWLDGTSLNENVVLPKLTTALFGFGCGTWQFTGDGVKFSINSDLDVIEVLHADGSQETGMLCKVARGITDRVGKNVKVAYHTKTQLQDSGGNPVINRWEVRPDKEVSFMPKDCDPTKEPDRCDWGALFKGRLGQLPVQHGLIVHQCQLIPASDPTTLTLRPTGRITMVLKVDFEVIAGKCTKLA